MRIRMAALAAATAALAGGVLVTGAGAANAAAPTPQVRVVQAAGGNYWNLVIYNGGQAAGMGQWSQDAQDGNPGDALRAYDGLADGYGIHAYLSDGRRASTAGHSSPYWSGWVTGDLPEGDWHTLKVCIEKAGVDYSCISASVQS